MLAPVDKIAKRATDVGGRPGLQDNGLLRADALPRIGPNFQTPFDYSSEFLVTFGVRTGRAYTHTHTHTHTHTLRHTHRRARTRTHTASVQFRFTRVGGAGSA